MSTGLLAPNNKRTFHCFKNEIPHCSPRRIQFLTLNGAKRQRNEGPPSTSQVSYAGSGKRSRDDDIMHTSPCKRIRRPAGYMDVDSGKTENQSPNPFPEFKIEHVKLAAIPKPKKKNKKVYTLDQVQKIVVDSLKCQEEKLRAEYNKVLQRLLKEQFDSFTQFNQDYIARHISKERPAYIS